VFTQQERSEQQMETMSVCKRIMALTNPPGQAGDGAVRQLNGTHNFATTKPQ